MILNFANSELHFSYNARKVLVRDRVSGRIEEAIHEQVLDSHLILDIQDMLMFKFNVWSLDRDNFEKIRCYVRQIKVKYM